MSSEDFGYIAHDESLPPGAVIALRYTVVRQLGSGGMGAVYLAEDALLNGDHVAVKVLHTSHLEDQNQVARFLREVQLMRRVQHHNVVRTFDVGGDGNLIYFTMEYVEGKQLDQLLGPLGVDLSKAASYIIQMCDALEAIHNAGIMHRDLKPGNVLVEEGDRIRITDFGVARPEVSDITKHNEIIGSVCYMAPEVWLGKKLTPSIDLYSLGIICYELATGRVPFDAETPASLMRLHLDSAVVPPKNINDAVPHWLNKLTVRLLAKTPEERPRDAREVSDFVRKHSEISVGEASGVIPSIRTEEATSQFFNVLEETNRRRSMTNIPRFNPDDPALSSLDQSNAKVSVVRRSVVAGKGGSSRTSGTSTEKAPRAGHQIRCGRIVALLTIVVIGGVFCLFPLAHSLPQFNIDDVLGSVPRLKNVTMLGAIGGQSAELLLRIMLWSLPALLVAPLSGAGLSGTIVAYLGMAALQLLNAFVLAAYFLVPSLAGERMTSAAMASALASASRQLDSLLLLAPVTGAFEQVRLPEGVVQSAAGLTTLVGAYHLIPLLLVTLSVYCYLGWARWNQVSLLKATGVALLATTVIVVEGVAVSTVSHASWMRAGVLDLPLSPVALMISVANMLLVLFLPALILRQMGGPKI